MQNQTSLQKIRDLIRDVEEDLALIERQAKLGMLSHSEAESICTSIIQSITELNTIHLFKEDNYRAMENWVSGINTMGLTLALPYPIHCEFAFVPMQEVGSFKRQSPLRFDEEQVSFSWFRS